VPLETLQNVAPRIRLGLENSHLENHTSRNDANVLRRAKRGAFKMNDERNEQAKRNEMGGLA